MISCRGFRHKCLDRQANVTSGCDHLKVLQVREGCMGGLQLPLDHGRPCPEPESTRAASA